jgi:hypothetical protein
MTKKPPLGYRMRGNIKIILPGSHVWNRVLKIPLWIKHSSGEEVETLASIQDVIAQLSRSPSPEMKEIQGRIYLQTSTTLWFWTFAQPEARKSLQEFVGIACPNEETLAQQADTEMVELRRDMKRQGLRKD